MCTRKILVILCLLTSMGGVAQTTKEINLLPFPEHVNIQSGYLKVSENFCVAIHAPGRDSILLNAVNRSFQTLNRRTGLYFKQKRILFSDNSDTATLQITVKRSSLPKPGVDESYSLCISSNKIELNAATTIGALRGLESILQLLQKSKKNGFYITALSIQDSPRFQWRGLMIDVARHFIPIDVLQRNIDAMSLVKMNVLHLHLTDNEGFRVESKLFPQLQGRGSNGEYYTQAQIRDLVTYAEARGIMIVPEFDMPAHTKSWFAGYPELASAPGPYEPGPPIDFHSVQKMNLGDIMQLVNKAPFPAFDPTKETTYDFVDKFLGEMASLFPSQYVHIGADENNGVVWKNNPSIVAFMEKNHLQDTHALQAYFVKRVSEILKKHHKQIIGWEELFSKEISKDITVQVWQNGAYKNKALQNHNPVLISKGFYLDLFMPAYIHYNNNEVPKEVPDSVSSLLKGGEAAQWTEAADKTNIETRIWPRAAAVAERLWSSASINNTDDLYRRLFDLSDQLDENGLEHISSYERSLRRIAGGDFMTLKTFTDVLSPVKGYKKLFSQLMSPESMSYQTAPLLQISDIVLVDSRTKWEFRLAVQSYLIDKDSASEAIIRNFLNLWQRNHEDLKGLIEVSGPLKRVEDHSKNLSVLASIGLDALDKIKHNAAPDPNWINSQLNVIKSASKPQGETELTILPEIESLVQRKLQSLPDSYPVF